MGKTTVFKSAFASTASGLEKLRRDAVLNGVANDGARFLFDLESPFSWPLQENPANNNAVITVTYRIEAVA